MPVAILRRNVDVNQRQTEGKRGPVVEVRLDKFGPLRRDFAGKLSVAITGQVGENDLWARLSRPAHLEEIDAAGAAGSRTGACQLGFDERVNDAGLAHVGAAEKGDFRQTCGGEVRGVGGSRHESGHYTHVSVCYEVARVGKGADDIRSRLSFKLLAIVHVVAWRKMVK